MAEHVALNADKLKLVKKALRCPAKLIKSDVEKEFVKETKERLEKFGDDIYLSEKQLAWLGKIASRLDDKPKKSEAAETADDLPVYSELAGE